MDKIKELEERLNRLELKTKASFLEVEKRMGEVPSQIKLPEDIDERFNELEDLILLMQVESTKIKERMTGGLGFGAETDTQSINERINELEERMSEISTARETAGIPDYLLEKINMIDEHNSVINELKDRLDMSGRASVASLPRIGPKIERKPAKARKRIDEEEEEPVVLPSSNILSEVNEILEGG